MPKLPIAESARCTARLIKNWNVRCSFGNAARITRRARALYKLPSCTKKLHSVQKSRQPKNQTSKLGVVCLHVTWIMCKISHTPGRTRKKCAKTFRDLKLDTRFCAAKNQHQKQQQQTMFFDPIAEYTEQQLAFVCHWVLQFFDSRFVRILSTCLHCSRTAHTNTEAPLLFYRFRIFRPWYRFTACVCSSWMVGRSLKREKKKDVQENEIKTNASAKRKQKKVCFSSCATCKDPSEAIPFAAQYIPSTQMACVCPSCVQCSWCL